MTLDLKIASIDPKAMGKVAVLMGGNSAEREVSATMSGPGVLAALQARGVDVLAFDPAQRSLHELQALGVQRAFIALHGRGGEDGTVQGALELLRIPYTGSGVMASAIAMDKITTKRLWQSVGLPTPRWVSLAKHQQQREQLMAVPDELGLPVFVKPPHEGSSMGATKVNGYSDMQEAVALAARFDSEVLCEEFIDGQEFTCAVLGQGEAAVALPVVEICAEQGNYDYQNKYFTNSTVYKVGQADPQWQAQVQQLVLQAYRVLGCRGWGRADLMLSRKDGRVYLLEMNTSPGMTSHSLVPKAAAAVGVSYEELCLWLLSQARLDSQS
ncbi:D-alanine--D-alanine ligase [Roseateles sp. BYS180W]|uniref:D-alanine--D-alanine ligase n=1 Tax=Roseateles rivi TaxID=3299028 RepID=A0ABW7FRQ4_9BURK